MSKYNIRPPFAVHLEKITETEQPGGSKIRQRTAQSFFPGQPVELSDNDAMTHLHKLEPADSGAKKLIDEFHEFQARAAAARSGANSGPSLAQEVSAAVVNSLIAAGVIKQKAA